MLLHFEPALTVADCFFYAAGAVLTKKNDPSLLKQAKLIVDCQQYGQHNHC
jgi:hypothetical protein